MQAAARISQVSKADFLAMLPDLLAIYAAAMAAPPQEVPGRRAIMERHADNPGFRAVAATDGTGRRTVGFAYCFRGVSGQWWHDVVRAALRTRYGAAAAEKWLTDTLEIAEVHVHPDYQARGIGRRMLFELTDGRAERTAVLSTRDADTPARRLYRSLGFTDLLTEFVFPGGGPAYAVMGGLLPLAASQVAD